MATITKTQSGTWKAIIRKRGWPTAIKTFRTKRDAQDWGRRTEDEMVRGIYIHRALSERTSIHSALKRYLAEATPTKKPSTQRAEVTKSKTIAEHLGDYGLAALTPDIVAEYRDMRLAKGKSNNTVRLELALLSHPYTVAIREWGVGLVYNPVANIRRPSPGQGRNRRLSWSETRRLLRACDRHSNPMLGWIVRTALYTGMRPGEIVSITRRQVNLQRRLVRLDETRNGSARTVPLTRRAVGVFRQALDHPIRPKDTELVLYGEPGRDGKRRLYTTNRVWEQALKNAGITNLHFHDLRYEATSRFVEAGLSDQEVASITGHKPMQMLKCYTHLRAEDLVTKLDRAVN